MPIYVDEQNRCYVIDHNGKRLIGQNKDEMIKRGWMGIENGSDDYMSVCVIGIILCPIQLVQIGDYYFGAFGCSC